MVYAELIYETGANSVGCYDSKEEALAAVAAHHERATKGEKGGPTGAAAERIVEVQFYDKHPNDLNIEQTISTDVAKKEVAALLDSLDDGGAISTVELSAAVRDLATPLVSKEDSEGQKSIFKMPAKEVLKEADNEGWAV